MWQCGGGRVKHIGVPTTCQHRVELGSEGGGRAARGGGGEFIWDEPLSNERRTVAGAALWSRTVVQPRWVALIRVAGSRFIGL